MGGAPLSPKLLVPSATHPNEASPRLRAPAQRAGRPGPQTETAAPPAPAPPRTTAVGNFATQSSRRSSRRSATTPRSGSGAAPARSAAARSRCARLSGLRRGGVAAGGCVGGARARRRLWRAGIIAACGGLASSPLLRAPWREDGPSIACAAHLSNTSMPPPGAPPSSRATSAACCRAASASLCSRAVPAAGAARRARRSALWTPCQRCHSAIAGVRGRLFQRRSAQGGCTGGCAVLNQRLYRARPFAPATRGYGGTGGRHSTHQIDTFHPYIP
jgi:hypothetical protein